MRTQNISAGEALNAVQALRPIAEPNDGFMRQLMLYGDIGFDVSTNRTEYRRFLMASMAAQREMFGYIKEMTLASDPQNAPAKAAAAPGTGGAGPMSTTQRRPLKCKKCRRALVAWDSVISHTPGQGQASFEYRKRDATLHISEV